MLPNYKDIVELLKQGFSVEAQEKILELREGAMALQEENIELRQKVKALEDQLAVRAKMQWEAPHYWVHGEGKERDGPYCQACYDKDAKLIRLQNLRRGKWHCQVCSKTFYDSTYHPPQAHRVTNGPGNWMGR
jgi:ribosomal protein L37AE/L43A